MCVLTPLDCLTESRKPDIHVYQRVYYRFLFWTEFKTKKIIDYSHSKAANSLFIHFNPKKPTFFDISATNLV